MTPFCFEHVFRAASPDALFSAYFSPDHQQEQDRAVDIIAREVLELVDRGPELYRVSRVTPRRQIPAVLRPLSPGPLHYLEELTWHRPSQRISIEIRPSLLGGRARICATYEVEPAGPGLIRRRYAGQVSVDVALLARRVEKGLVEELARSVPVAAARTQAWLDRQSPTDHLLDHSSPSVATRP